LPAEANTHNPVDIIGDARADRYETALKVLIEDDQVDQILVLLTPQRTTEVVRTAEAVAKIAQTSDKNIVASFVGGARSSEGIPVFAKHKIPHFEFPIDATRVMSLLANQKKLEEGTLPITHLNFDPDAQIKTWINVAKANNWPSLPQDQVNYILEKYGFDFPHNCGFSEYGGALECAKQMFPNPAVLKISAPDALHKTDVQGVVLNVNDVSKFEQAWQALAHSIEVAGYQNAHIQVQEQIPQGTEIIMGITRDANFGPVMLFGSGGIYTEVFKDTTVRVLPTHDFADMIEETKVGQILHGVRGEKPKAIEPLIEVMHKLQRLVLDYPEILSIDINPVMVTEDRAVCVDFKILV
jgi:acetyltransferase